MFPNRWLAYFDILGFSVFVQTEPNQRVLRSYTRALRLFKNTIGNDGLSHVHFSDTFIYYSTDDSVESFTWIQSRAKNFIRNCLRESIPLRGVITFGEFYADAQESIFLGKALIDAHNEEESQDWIGLILTKSAEKRVLEYGLDPARFQYPIVNVPKKVQQSAVNPFKNVKHPAYNFHGQMLSELGIMQKLASADKHKYQNTINNIKNQKINYHD